MVGVLTAVTSLNTGLVVSMVKALTLRLSLVFPAGSVTVMEQLLYSPSDRALKVTVLLSDWADVLPLEQLPPYWMVPGFDELKV